MNELQVICGLSSQEGSAGKQWACALFGEMRANKIKDKELAAEIGWHPKYLSRGLNGHTNPKGAQEKIMSALQRLISSKEHDNKETIQ